MASKPLKRKSEWRYDHLPRLAIYQDDVQSLFDLFTARFRKVDLSAGEYELPDVASLADLGQKPLHAFSIRGSGLGGGYGGDASVTIDPRYVQIWVSDDQDVELLGIAQAARVILIRRVRRVSHLIVLALIIGPFLPWTAEIIAVSAGLLRLDIVQSLTVTILMIAFGAALLVTGVRLRRTSHGTLYAYPSSSRRTWWDRNGDSVVSGMVAALVGGLILLAIELALGVLRLPGSTPAP